MIPKVKYGYRWCSMCGKPCLARPGSPHFEKHKDYLTGEVLEALVHGGLHPKGERK